MADCMMFPEDWHDFIKDYSFIDSERVYTNGSELIQVLRVTQLIEHLLNEQQQKIWELQDQVEYLTDKQKEQKFLVDSDGKITPLPVVVRCKDCIHRGKSEKCVLAAISEEKDCPLFMLDNRGEWFCADGKRR